MSHYNLGSQVTFDSPTTLIPSFEQDHFFLLELANIFEPLSTQHFDQSYQSIEALIYEDPWDEHIDGPIPSEAIDCTPQHWYTQYWFDCAFAHQCANLTGLDFRDICDYEFTDDETIYTGHFLDLY